MCLCNGRVLTLRFCCALEAATTVAMVFGLGSFFGLLLGGAGGSYLYSKDRRWPALLSGGTAMAGCLPFWALINVDNAANSPSFVYFSACAAGFLSGATGPIVRATLQNVTLPQARGQAFALFNTFDDFGRGTRGPDPCSRMLPTGISDAHHYAYCFGQQVLVPFLCLLS